MKIKIDYTNLLKLINFGKLSLENEKEYIGFLIIEKNKIIDVVNWKIRSKNFSYIEYEDEQLTQKLERIDKEFPNNEIGGWHTHIFGYCSLSQFDKECLIDNYEKFGIKYELIVAINKRKKESNFVIKQLNTKISIYEKDFIFKFGIWKIYKNKQIKNIVLKFSN